MRIHGVRLIAVRMSPSRRCQTSWRARPTTADADVGIEGTDDALAETRHARASTFQLPEFFFFSDLDPTGDTCLGGPRTGTEELLVILIL